VGTVLTWEWGGDARRGGEETRRRRRAEEIGEYSGGVFSATLSPSPFSPPEYVLQIGTRGKKERERRLLSERGHVEPSDRK
jgi:hypothetical protein